MRAICMPQPWASLICAGLQDVMSMAWKPKENPGRIAVVATRMQIPLEYHQALPECWSYRLDNFLLMGQMPRLADLPIASIVGYVDVTGFSEKEESIWSLPDCINWKLANPCTLKNPIPCDAMEQFVFDTDLIDSDNLPETIAIPQPTLTDDGVLTLPLHQQKFDSLADGDKELDINLYADNRDLFTGYTGKIWNPRTVKQLVAVSPTGQTARYEVVKTDLILDRDDDGMPVKIEKAGGWEYLYYMLYTIGEKI
ncbi:MAG: hypothetical protein IJ628_09290 [Bacteroidaceae bacterium]|nr:hypothetical protein [Bacteroidaceae bacterium]MBR1542785.1 hypothetical protein [Bacteroidaceae bacterium]